MVASGRVHASLTLLRFRDTSFFFSSFVHSNLSLWTKILSDSPVHSAFVRYLECGVDVHDIFLVRFEGSFQGQVYSSPSPLRAHFTNSRSCHPLSEFISKIILERVANGSLSVWGKVGVAQPFHLVMPITMEPTKPQTCHDERDFLTYGSKTSPFPWIFLPTSLVTSTRIASKPHATTRVDMTISAFHQTAGCTSVFSGMGGNLFLIISPLGGRLARTFITLLV